MTDQYYVQLYMSKQEQQRKQLLKDSFILVDIIHRTISSAEKYAINLSILSPIFL